jgi:hypothetical protein
MFRRRNWSQEDHGFLELLEDFIHVQQLCSPILLERQRLDTVSYSKVGYSMIIRHIRKRKVFDAAARQARRKEERLRALGSIDRPSNVQRAVAANVQAGSQL